MDQATRVYWLRVMAAVILFLAGVGGCLAVIYQARDVLQWPFVLLGLAPQALPPGTIPKQKVLRVLGWIWFGIPTALFIALGIAIENGVALP